MVKGHRDLVKEIEMLKVQKNIQDASKDTENQQDDIAIQENTHNGDIEMTENTHRASNEVTVHPAKKYIQLRENRPTHQEDSEMADDNRTTDLDTGEAIIFTAEHIKKTT